MIKTMLCAAAFAAALAVPASAQMAPGDTGPGMELGLAAVNSSGQVGWFRVFRSSGNPQIVVKVEGAPAGRAQAVTVSRGSHCDDSAGAGGMVLGNAVGGRLSATSPLPLDRLMSGNYSIVVHNNTPASRAVLCGQIYLTS